LKREQRLPTSTAPAAAWRIAAEHCSSQPRTADPHPWSELLLPPFVDQLKNAVDCPPLFRCRREPNAEPQA